jgi:hypothetical protein
VHCTLFPLQKAALSHVVASQLGSHWEGAIKLLNMIQGFHNATWIPSGVIPHLAARAHETNLPWVLRQAINERFEAVVD